MDERHHHENDLHGTFSSASAARAKLAELDQHAEQQAALPDLQAMLAAVLREKQTVAEQIAAHGASAATEKNPDRQRLVDRLQVLAAAQRDLNARIAAIPPVMAAPDRAAHIEDLQRRTGAGAGTGGSAEITPAGAVIAGNAAGRFDAA